MGRQWTRSRKYFTLLTVPLAWTCNFCNCVVGQSVEELRAYIFANIRVCFGLPDPIWENPDMTYVISLNYAQIQWVLPSMFALFKVRLYYHTHTLWSNSFSWTTLRLYNLIKIWYAHCLAGMDVPSKRRLLFSSDTPCPDPVVVIASIFWSTLCLSSSQVSGVVRYHRAL